MVTYHDEDIHMIHALLTFIVPLLLVVAVPDHELVARHRPGAAGARARVLGYYSTVDRDV